MFSFWGTTEPKKKTVVSPRIQPPVISTTPPQQEEEHDEIETVRSPQESLDTHQQVDEGDMVLVVSSHDKELIGVGDETVGSDELEGTDRYGQYSEPTGTLESSEKSVAGEFIDAPLSYEAPSAVASAEEAPVPSGEESEIDLDFVEQFDDAFNEYVSRNPDFLIANPDMVHNLRVTKLQLLLERQDVLETEMMKHFNALQTAKAEMEAGFQQALKDAARMKAAREIHLQSHLGEVNSSIKAMEAQLIWELVTSSEIRAKKQAQLLQESQNKGAAAGTHREALLDLLPDGPDFDSIRDAVLAPAAAVDAASLSDQQKDDLRQFQMDNAFLQAEVTVLQKKLAYQKIAAKQHAWAEAVLVRMDDKTLKKLKNRYQKKVGILL